VSRLDQIATALRCDQIRFIVHDDCSHVLQTLRGIGVGAEGITLCRPVSRPTIQAAWSESMAGAVQCMAPPPAEAG
jgi:hypothetical protein